MRLRILPAPEKSLSYSPPAEGCRGGSPFLIRGLAQTKTPPRNLRLLPPSKRAFFNSPPPVESCEVIQFWFPSLDKEGARGWS